MPRRVSSRRPSRAGMTLSDAMVAISVLAILAAFAVPTFRGPAPGSQEAALDATTARLRSQIDLYRFQHHGALPGDAGTEADLLDDLLLTSDGDGHSDGDRAADTVGTMPYGPYLTDEFPRNPHNGRNGVHVGQTPPDDDAAGWWYHPATGEIRGIDDSRR